MALHQGQLAIASIVKAYRSVRRYMDAGSVLFRPDEASAWEEARRFSTSFVRGEHLRLQVRLLECGGEDDDTALVVVDAPGTRTGDARLQVLGKRAKRLPLADALAAASGVTSSVSWLVPNLLLGLPEGIAWFKGLFDPTPVADAFRIADSHGTCIALIDSETMLLRSLEVAMPTPAEPGFRQRIVFTDFDAR